MTSLIRRCFLALLLGALAASAGPLLYTLASGDAENFELSSIDSGGTLNPLFNVGPGATGGLAFDPMANTFYAIFNNSDALSTLNAISWGGVVEPLFELGYGYFGGLAWAGEAGSLYAIGGDTVGIQRTLYQIDVAGKTSAWVADLASGEFSFDGGLAFAGNQLYLLGHNGVDPSNLFSYSPLAVDQGLDRVYRSVFFPAAGGLALDQAQGVWWALTADSETSRPMVVSFNAGGPGTKFGFDLGLTGLTLAEDSAAVPEPASALLLAAGLAAILSCKRGAKRPQDKEKGRKS
jgi:hypothetical protein